MTKKDKVIQALWLLTLMIVGVLFFYPLVPILGVFLVLKTLSKLEAISNTPNKT